MPALASITVNDGKGTPAAHVFAPVTTNGQKSQLANRAASIASGFETLDLEVAAPVNASAGYRFSGKLVAPVVAVVSGVDTVIRKSQGSFIFNFAPDSTAAERSDVLAMLGNALLNATVKTMAANVEPLY